MLRGLRSLFVVCVLPVVVTVSSAVQRGEWCTASLVKATSSWSLTASWKLYNGC